METSRFSPKNENHPTMVKPLSYFLNVLGMHVTMHNFAYAKGGQA